MNNLAVPGQIETRHGEFLRVTIAELTDMSCRTAEPLPQLDPQSVIGVWLGAIGPLIAHIKSGSRTCLEFDGAIHASIVNHFNA